MYPPHSEEWSLQQQSCVQHLHEGVEGVTSLLCQFSQGQMSTGREKSIALQDSLTQSQINTKQFQVNEQDPHVLGCVWVGVGVLFSFFVQESLVSTTDTLLTATLWPLLTGLSNQLALQSSLLTQSTASIRTQVRWHATLYHIIHMTQVLYVSIHVCNGSWLQSGLGTEWWVGYIILSTFTDRLT